MNTNSRQMSISDRNLGPARALGSAGEGAPDLPLLFSVFTLDSPFNSAPLAIARTGGSGGQVFVYAEERSSTAGNAPADLVGGSSRILRESLSSYLLPVSQPSPGSLPSVHEHLLTPPSSYPLHPTPHISRASTSHVSLPLTPTSSFTGSSHEHTSIPSTHKSATITPIRHRATVPFISILFPYQASFVDIYSHPLDVVTPPHNVLSGFIFDHPTAGRHVFIPLAAQIFAVSARPETLGANFSEVLRPYDPMRLSTSPSGLVADVSALDLRESLTALLDLASDQLEGKLLVLVLDRSEADTQSLGQMLHSLMYVGGQVVGPGGLAGGLEWDRERWVAATEDSEQPYMYNQGFESFDVAYGSHGGRMMPSQDHRLDRQVGYSNISRHNNHSFTHGFLPDPVTDPGYTGNTRDFGVPFDPFDRSLTGVATASAVLPGGWDLSHSTPSINHGVNIMTDEFGYRIDSNTPTSNSSFQLPLKNDFHHSYVPTVQTETNQTGSSTPPVSRVPSPAHGEPTLRASRRRDPIPRKVSSNSRTKKQRVDPLDPSTWFVTITNMLTDPKHWQIGQDQDRLYLVSGVTGEPIADYQSFRAFTKLSGRDLLKSWKLSASIAGPIGSPFKTQRSRAWHEVAGKALAEWQKLIEAGEIRIGEYTFTPLPGAAEWDIKKLLPVNRSTYDFSLI
ncbi:hypothetical protein M231_02209 [Tremella mesenterica]|uniref:Uncharacterized protein n=1 Tax=Tremella mesenterica TaxID=5217 RepID=A0A4V1M4J2_TREME|nr:hypothetical protein M231_02209 [Tremella mesenterica]